MKLFVFYNICADWTSGMAIAIANTKEEAIQILIDKEKTKTYRDHGQKPTANDIMNDNISSYEFDEKRSVICEERDIENGIGYFIRGGG